MFTGLSDLIVYLAEPSAMQAKAIAMRLAALDVRTVHRFVSGGEVLAKLFESQPSVVISAFYLPDMTGVDLVQSMRVDTDLRHVPFVLISSESRPHILDPVRQSGVCGILPKPFSDTQLSKALHATIDYLGQDDMLEELGIDLEGMRVLIVDDSSSSRGFIRRVLENLGMATFLEAENGLEAAQLLKETAVDLVVTDYNMPEMDGKALVEHIRRQSWQSSVPILMVTSESSQGRLAAIEEAGVSGICDKPFEPEIVKSLLRKLLQPE